MQNLWYLPPSLRWNACPFWLGMQNRLLWNISAFMFAVVGLDTLEEIVWLNIRSLRGYCMAEFTRWPSALAKSLCCSEPRMLEKTSSPSSIPPTLLKKSISSASSVLFGWRLWTNPLFMPENKSSSSGRRFPIVWASISSRDPSGSPSELENVVSTECPYWTLFGDNITARKKRCEMRIRKQYA